MSIKQEMHCSDLALLNNCALHSFLRCALLILKCVIMWAAEHKIQGIWLVIVVFGILLKI